ncbi:MAG TPA: VOC family protein [Actinomycetota bacterium]|nr:VOC family protein [Actinomycetota bacterium]
MDLRDAPFAVTIPCRDLVATRRFYEDLLQLPLEADEEAGLYYRSRNTLIGLYQTEAAGTAAHTLGGWEVDDIEATVRALRERGVHFEEYELPGLTTADGIADLGSERSAWFKDPEGNILAVYQRRATSRY